MRALIQRVDRAEVRVDSKMVGSIEHGLLVFVGIELADDEEDDRWLVNKILNLRIFSDEEGVMNRSLLEVEEEILLVSQFTLHAKTKKGNRPSYIKAASPDVARRKFERLLEIFEEEIPGFVQSGKFGANMKVELVNDGPVTIWLDTKQKE
ncbi:MAG TPA: D-tyrosyl-tRNA(Tyr) deacylase [Flavobacteriales bacterium]|jgi:D-aminoacyl-tRNA deacylase|nr:D-tyrosyl-tRNA(Tyr) deacylase [Flavobacteriales bacterium]